jgi:hypothetical protein
MDSQRKNDDELPERVGISALLPSPPNIELPVEKRLLCSCAPGHN